MYSLLDLFCFEASMSIFWIMRFERVLLTGVLLLYLPAKSLQNWRFLGLGLVLGHNKIYKRIVVIDLLRTLATLGKR
jgi:hypothetical protein